MRISKRFGVGILDTDSPVRKRKIYYDDSGKRSEKVLWVCPFYVVWHNMLKRCYSEAYQRKYPTYEGCTVCEEWLTFSNFKLWMESQNWEGGKQLDKDFLFPNNKTYSPDACVFISGDLNKFLNDHKRSKGVFKTGVYWYKKYKCFKSQCSNPISKKREHLGYFGTEEEAHQAWRNRKHDHALALANLQEDERVAMVLRLKHF